MTLATPAPRGEPPLQAVRRPRRHTGAGRIGSAIALVLVGALAFATYRIVPFYYYYFELCSQMSAVVPVAGTLTDGEIRRKLNDVIERLGIPATAEALRIGRKNQRINLSVRYQESLLITVFGEEYELLRIPFEAQASGPL